PGVNSQVFLADATLPPHPTKIPSDARATDHVPQGSNLKVAIPSDIHYILRRESMRLALLLMFATAGLGPPAPAQGQESPSLTPPPPSAPLTSPPPEPPPASSPVPDLSAHVDALVGQWGLNANCGAPDARISISRDEAQNSIGLRQGGLIVLSHEGLCHLFYP